MEYEEYPPDPPRDKQEGLPKGPLVLSTSDITPSRLVNILNSSDEVSGKMVLLAVPGLYDRTTVFKAVVKYVCTLLEEVEDLPGALQVLRTLLSHKKIVPRVHVRVVASALLERTFPLLTDVLLTATSELLWSTFQALVQIARVPQIVSALGCNGGLAALHAYVVTNLTPISQQREEDYGVMGVERILWLAVHLVALRSPPSEEAISHEVVDGLLHVTEEVIRAMPELHSATSAMVSALSLSDPTRSLPSKLKLLLGTNTTNTMASLQTTSHSYFRNAAAVVTAATEGGPLSGVTTPTGEMGGDDDIVFGPGKISFELISSISKVDRRRDETLRSYLGRISHLNLNTLNLRNARNLQYCTNLRVLNLDDNKLSSLGDLAFATSLTHLYLQRNDITSLADAPTLPSLQKLYLGENMLTSLEGISQCCPNVQELHLGSQRSTFMMIDPTLLQGLKKLTILCLSNNNLPSIEALMHHPSLKELDLRNNLLEGLEETCDILSTLNSLTSVMLLGNAVLKAPKAKDRIILSCSRVQLIDDVPVTSQERQFLSQIHTRRPSFVKAVSAGRRATNNGQPRPRSGGEDQVAVPGAVLRERKQSTGGLDFTVQAHSLQK
eukprot:PhF_6_TR25288/c0_g1_i1/m.34877/K17579/PPP1R42, LRRC67; protein phosphatase 1 regulatory subunit 42